MSKKEDLFNAYEAYGKDRNFMVIHISMPSLKIPEAIVNYKSNFDEKLKYYGEVYNDDLVMIRNENIRVVDFEFADSITMEVEGNDGFDNFESISSVEYNGMLSPNKAVYTVEDSSNTTKRKEEEVLSFEQMCFVLGLETED